MNGIVKKAAAALLSLLFCLYFTPGAGAEGADEKNLLVLGDSIATGYGLSDYAPDGDPKSALSWSSLLSRQLGYTQTNLAVDGAAASDTYDRLLTESYISAVGESDLICISLGGNDIGYLANNVTVPSFDPTKPDSVTAAYAAFAAAYVKVTQEIDGVVEEFGNNLDAVFKQLRSVKEDSVVVIQTLYNPYKNVNVTIMSAGVSYSFSTLADECVRKLNVKLKAVAADNGVYVADVYTEFEKQTDGSYLRAHADGLASVLSGSYSLDPHPTEAGHAAISGVYEAALAENSLAFVTETATDTQTAEQTDETVPETLPPETTAPETTVQPDTEPAATKAPDTEPSSADDSSAGGASTGKIIIIVCSVAAAAAAVVIVVTIIKSKKRK